MQPSLFYFICVTVTQSFIPLLLSARGRGHRPSRRTLPTPLPSFFGRVPSQPIMTRFRTLAAVCVSTMTIHGVRGFLPRRKIVDRRMSRFDPTFSALLDGSSGLSTLRSGDMKKVKGPRKTALAVSVSVMLCLLYISRSAWQPLLDKNKIQATTLSILSSLKGPEGSNQLIPLVSYGFLMALVEMLGLSTIPVETAAAMVFKWYAWPASAIGKLVGALSAFGLGRTLLQDLVHRKLQTGTQLPLLEASAEEHPVRTAFLIKCSCFPELVKNGCPAVLPAIRTWMFVLATICHGWSYTTLWTWVGVDAERQLSDTSAVGSVALNSVLVLSGVFGIVCTPLLTAWWLRSLQKMPELKRKKL